MRKYAETSCTPATWLASEPTRVPTGDSSVRLNCTSGMDIEDEDEAALSTRVTALVEKYARTSASSVRGIGDMRFRSEFGIWN